MSDAILPSWRVRPPERTRAGLGSIPPKVWMVLGGLGVSVALAGGMIWFMGQWGPRGIPVIEPDGRPFKVRPDSPGGAVVPNQQERIFERGSARQAENPAAARLTPGPEAPRPEILRGQQAEAPRPAASPAPAAPAVQPVPGAQPRAATPPTQPAAAPAAQVAQPQAQHQRTAPAASGRVQVQLGALRSDEAARQEWERLQRAVPELAGRSPAITRLDRGEGQPPLFRLRTGGLPDAAAARALCDAVKARSGNCNVVNPG